MRKRDELTGRKLQNEELHSLHSSPNIIRVIKLKGMRRGAYGSQRGDKKCLQNFVSRV
jgi:hypothetical protein